MRPEPEVVGTEPAQGAGPAADGSRRPARAGLVLFLVLVVTAVGALVLFVGYRTLPEDRAMEADFSAAGGIDLGNGQCALLQVSGRMRAQATRDLGPLTRWTDVRLGDSTVRASLRELTDDGSCPAGSRVVDARTFRIVQRWVDADPRFALFDEGNEFTATISTGPIEFAGDRRGRQICVRGAIGADFGTSTGEDTPVLDVQACLPEGSG